MRSLLLMLFAGLLVLGGVAACSNNSSPGIHDAGLPFTINESVFLLPPGSQEVYFYLSDHTGLCALLNSGLNLYNLKTTNTLILDLVNLDALANKLPVDAGTYQVVPNQTVSQPGLYAFTGLVGSDSACDTGEADGSQGSVVLGSINSSDGGSAVGTYDIVFLGTQRVQGSFNANFCNYAYDGGLVTLPDGGAPCL